jgi:hypothetical protein
MPVCIYKSPDDGICCCTTSGHHCENVSNSICNSCDRHQEETIVSDKVLLRRVIEQAITALKNDDKEEAFSLLNEGLKI